MAADGDSYLPALFTCFQQFKLCRDSYLAQEVTATY